MSSGRYRRRSTGKIVELKLEETIGIGGEAKVHPFGADLCAKVFHEPTPQRAAKLELMFANPPEIPVSDLGHVMLTWPLDLLEDPETNEVVGYLMDRAAGMRNLVDFYNPKIRQRVAPGFHAAYLLRTVRNLAVAVEAVHAMGYVIGDLNESNILAKETALITLVDMDSIQVTNPTSGEVYRSTVGKIEYTPPESQGKAFDKHDRSVEHDRFALGVLIFQLLMEGTHPFAGTPSEIGASKPLGTRIQEGLYPYHAVLDLGYAPRRTSPRLESLHPALQKLIQRCFEDGQIDPSHRPDAASWVEATQAAEAATRICGRNPQHHYSDHQSRCPWCVRVLRLDGYDSFPPPTGATRDAPALEVSVENRNLRQLRAAREQNFSRVSAALLPLLLVGAVSLLYSWVGDANAAADQLTKPNEAAATTPNVATTDAKAADTATGKEQVGQIASSEPIPEVDDSAEVKAAPGRAATVITAPPVRPSGSLHRTVDAHRQRLIATTQRLGGDTAKVAYVLRGRLADSAIHSIAATDDAVWVSTERGLLRFDPTTNRWSLIDSSRGFGRRAYGAVGNSPHGVVCSYRGYPGGARLLDLASETWRKVANTARCFAADDTYLWSGTGHGVVRTDFATGRMVVYGRHSGHLPGNDVSAIERLGQDLWIARRSAPGEGSTSRDSGGVSRLDSKTGEAEHFSVRDGLGHTSVADLAVDDLAIWTVYDGPGLGRFDLKTRRWQWIKIGIPPTPAQLRGGMTPATRRPLRGRTLAVENHRNVWIGGHGEDGLFWYGAESKKANRIVHMAGREVVDIAVGHGSVWALFSRREGGGKPSVIVRIHSDRTARRKVERRKQTGREIYNKLRLAETGMRGPRVDTAIREGRRWLQNHQERNGRFDTDGFMRHDKSGTPCDGAGGPGNDVGVTALAVLALLPGATSKEARTSGRRRAVERGVRWLTSLQNKTGRVGGGSGRASLYGHAMATIAFCRAHAAYGNARARIAAQSAVRFLQRAHTPGKAWRYQPNAGDGDTSVTAWCIEALITAADLNLKIDSRKLASVLDWLDSVTDHATGRTGYTGRNVPAYRPQALAKAFPPAQSEANTAAALFARFLLGQRPHNARAVTLALARLDGRSPSWGPGRIDLIEWYFSSHALWGLTGAEARQRAFQDPVLGAQQATGNQAGSWNPAGVWGKAGGRVYSTAMSLLILQASHRFGQRDTLRGLSDDPRLSALRSARGKPYAALSRELGGLGGRFRAKHRLDAALLTRVRRELFVARGAAGTTLRRAVALKDPILAGQMFARVAEDFAGLPTGDRSDQRLEALRNDPRVAAEMDAAARLAEVRALPNQNSRGYADAVRRFVAGNLGTRTAVPLIDELMHRNIHRGGKHAVGARILQSPKSGSVQVHLTLNEDPPAHLSLSLPHRWWERSEGKFATSPRIKSAAARLHIQTHPKRTLAQVSASVQRRVNATRASDTGRREGLKKSQIRVGDQRLAAKTWTYRTKAKPVVHRSVTLIQFENVVVELEYTLEQGSSDLDKILATMRLRSKRRPEKTFQVQSTGWQLQGTIPGLVRQPMDTPETSLVWHELGRRNKLTAKFRLRVARSGAPLADVVAAVHRRESNGVAATWTGQLREAPGIYWLIYTSRGQNGKHRATAFTRLSRELDLIWTYEGAESGVKKLNRILRSIRGRPVAPSR